MIKRHIYKRNLLMNARGRRGNNGGYGYKQRTLILRSVFVFFFFCAKYIVFRFRLSRT